MIRKTLLALALFVSLLAAQLTASSLEEEYNAFNAEQVEVMQHAYDLGKPFNMGYTMAAIAWKESHAGLYVLNLDDPAAGVFQNNIRSVIARHMQKDSTFKDTKFNRNLMAQRLAFNFDFSAAEALAELEYWQSHHGVGEWFSVWQSYNGGFWALRPETKGYRTSYAYAVDISHMVRFLIINKIFETREDKEGP